MIVLQPSVCKAQKITYHVQLIRRVDYESNLPSMQEIELNGGRVKNRRTDHWMIKMLNLQRPPNKPNRKFQPNEFSISLSLNQEQHIRACATAEQKIMQKKLMDKKIQVCID